MSETIEEQVLVIPRRAFDACGSFQGYSPNVTQYMDLLSGELFQYMPRSKAEQDETAKQIIPYVVFARRNENAIELLTYQRSKKSGETRLASKYSIGIGGHINSGDLDYQTALMREINEEISFGGVSPLSPGDPIGILNDDSNAVGRVHLGFVHLVMLDESAVIHRHEDALANLQWIALEELEDAVSCETMEFETWSLLCMKPTMRKALERSLSYVVAAGKLP